MRFNLTRVTKLSMYYSKYIVLLFTTFISFIGISQISTQSFLPEKDAHVVSSLPTNNFGLNNNLSVSYIFWWIIQYQKTAIKFDISSIPDNAIITHAELKLRITSGTIRNLSFLNLIEDWAETTITWENFPSQTTINQFNETPTTSTIGNTGVVFQHFENNSLKNIVQNWCKNEYTNFGLVIEPTTSGNMNNAYSSREAPIEYYLNATINPKPLLIVEYVMPIEITMTSIDHATSTAANDGSITVSASQGDQNYSYQWYNSSGNAIGTNSPTISELAYGWYGVKVTDGLGNESYMSFIVGVECETVSISYNPGPNYVDDAYISNRHYSFYMPTGQFSGVWVEINDLNTNFGTNTSLLIGREIPSFSSSFQVYNHNNRKSLLKFKMLLDAEFSIIKSDLKLDVFNISGSSNTPVLKRVSEPWAEHVVTYNNQPQHSGDIEKNTGITSNGTKTIDTKEFWQYWQNNPNYGFFIDLQYPNQNQNRSVPLRSSDYSSTSVHPKMEFEVSLKCQFIEPFSELTGGYYQVNNKLYFTYDEAYYNEDGVLNFAIYDAARNIVIDQSTHQVIHGDNRIIIPLNSIQSGYYTLEIKNSKNRKWFLRFQKQ